MDGLIASGNFKISICYFPQRILAYFTFVTDKTISFKNVYSICSVLS